MAKVITQEEYDEVLEDLKIAERNLRAKEEVIRNFSNAQTEGAAAIGAFGTEKDTLTKRADKAEARVKVLEDRVAKEKAERELNAADAEKAAKAEAEEIQKRISIQSEHSRFRLLTRAPAGERDCFGDPTTEVFDTGVYFNGGFVGGLYIPKAMVLEMARSIGMLTSEDSQVLSEFAKDSNERAAMAPEFAKELQNGIDRLIGEFNDKLDSAVRAVPVGDEDESGGKENPDSNAGQANDPDKGGDS